MNHKLLVIFLWSLSFVSFGQSLGINLGTSTSDTTEVCKGAVINLTTAPTGITAITGYSWQIVSSSNTSSTNTSSYSFNATLTGLYTITCTVYASDTVSKTSYINVLTPLSSVLISSLGNVNSQTLCSGTLSGTISSLLTGGAGSLVYSWEKKIGLGSWTTIGGNTVQLVDNSVLTDNTDYRLTVSNNAQGCSSMSSNIISFSTYSVLVAPNVMSSQMICYDSSPLDLMRAGASGGDGSYSYEWQMSSDNANWISITASSNTAYSPGALTSDTYYRSHVTDGCGNANSNSILIDVYDAIDAGTLAAIDLQLCYNSSTMLTISGTSGGDSNYTRMWEVSTDGINFSNISGLTGTSISTGNLTSDKYYRVSINSGCGVSDLTNVIQVAVANEFTIPSISYTGDQLICYNDNPSSMSIAATGGRAPYSYSWQKKVSSSSSWSSIANSNSGVFSEAIGLLTETDYRVLITSSDGCGTLTSNTQTIDVRAELAAPSITPGQTVCYDTDATVTRGVASGADGNYAYEWQFSTDNINYTGLNTIASSINTGDLTQNTYYRAKVSNSLCGSEKYSTSSEVTVRDALDAGNLSVSDDEICYSSFTSLNANDVSGADGNYTYQWQYLDNSVSSWTNTGSSSTSLTTGILSADRSYRVVVNSGCNIEDVTTTILIDVADEFTIGSIQNAGVDTICYNTKPTTLTITGAGGRAPYSYQWQRKLSSGSFWTNVGTNASSFNESTSQTESVDYRVLITSSDGCGTLTSNTQTIDVRAELAAPSITPGQTVCYDTDATVTRGVASGADGNYAYEWQFSTDNINYTGLNTIASSINTGDLTQNTYYRAKVSNSLCGSEKYSTSSEVTVRDALDAGNLSVSDDEICYSSFTSLNANDVSGADGNYTYQWQYLDNSVSSWTNTGSSSTSLTTGILSADRSYRVVVNSGCNIEDVTTTILIDVADEFTIGSIQNAGVDTICYNTKPTTLTITGAGGRAPYSYQWQRKLSSGSFWTNVGTNASSFNESTSQTESVDYRVVQTSSDGCGSLVSSIYQIYVRPDVTPPFISSDTIICHNTAIILARGSATGADGQFTYQWQQSTNNVTFTNTGVSNSMASTGDLTSTTWFRVQASNTLCATTKYSQVARVKVRDELTAGNLTTSDNQICYNSSTTLTLSNTAGADTNYSYSWQYKENGTVWLSFGLNSTTVTTPLHKYDVDYRVIVGSSCNVNDTSLTLGVDVADTLVIGDIVNMGLDTICFNTLPSTLNISGSGGRMLYTYQWQRRPLSGTSWSNVGMNLNSYTEGSMQTASVQYRVLLTSQDGCGTLISTPYTIIVRPDLVAPGISLNTVICHNTSTILSRGTASGADGLFSYQWQKSIDGINYSTLTQSGVNFNTGNLTSHTWYRVLAYNSLCATSILSNVVRVRIRDSLFAGTIAVIDDEICYNSIATLNVAGTAGADSNYSYDWQYNENNTSWISFSSNATNVVSPQHKNNVSYRVISNSGCNVIDMSNVINVTVADSLNAGMVSVFEDSVCFGSSPMLMSISANSGGYAPYGYNWERRIGILGSWNTVSTGVTTFQELDPLTEDTYYRISLTSDQGCGTVTTPEHKFRLNTLPGEDTWSILGPDVVCAGANGINYQISSNYNTGTIAWALTYGTLSSNSITKVFVDFDNVTSQTSDTVQVVLTSDRTACQRTIVKPIIISEESSPYVSEIVQKTGTNILICSDTSQGVKYHWGFITKSTGIVQLVSGATGRYHNFITSLDTMNIVYFVRTSYGTCHTFNYFGTSSNPLDLEEASLEVIIYPNPTSEYINIESNVRAQQVWLSESSGRLIHLELRNNRIRVPDHLPSGFYVLTLEIDGSLVQKKIIIDRR